MNDQRLPRTILRLASLLAPRDQRAGWLEEWRSELWYIPPRLATRFCLGAFQDALWLKRNNLSRVKPSLMHLESPLRCLAWLAVLAALSILMVIWLPGLKPAAAWPAHLSAGFLLKDCLGMLLLSCLLLLPTRFAIGATTARSQPLAWPNTIRRWMFLILKIALVQPIMLGELLILIWIGPLAALTPLGLFVSWILVFRWVLTDQLHRCPVCLRLLINPVRIGTSSQTFLEWYGAESMCSHGHGLLRVPEVTNGKQEWLFLGPSWSALFSEAGGRRQS